ncbi:MgtC/SapB family protein [Streptomyces smyrnaeus]|uniref:MgtC/SapB family protein n=1 Tax=Streptomyces TaxID=1883 RepID=UPI000C17A349|nr:MULTISPECIES: MgtC/SapB family protein [unclassified Streptomyces]MBQ0866266.1 MgtC/SapB family protein [Streptomyces sp. RK75]MBQ1121382.1 MgtC/SapB family protein [Streptomyces sp. B15]MBQ1158187.1 MgtC/SapB family protein [Streptomyces sp. A73]
MNDAFYSSLGQGWPQVANLALAFILTSLIGLERRAKNKSAGLRTHALVGLGAALFMLVSKYGFADLMGMEDISIDPSRVAAQVVSGVGFLGGGVIFLRRDVVRGLTTAAIVWVSAAVGMACGAGLPLLAVATVAMHFLTVWGFTKVSDRLPGAVPGHLRLTYEEGRGVLRNALSLCTERGFVVTETNVEQVGEPRPELTKLTLAVSGSGSVPELVGELMEVPGVLAVNGRAVSGSHDAD